MRNVLSYDLASKKIESFEI